MPQQNEPPVERLNRTRVRWIPGSERVNLRWRDRNRLGHHHPAYHFGTRRRGQGAGVAQVARFLRQKGARLQFQEGRGRLAGSRDGAPDALDRWMAFAGLHEHPDHREIPLFGLMHEVRLHGEPGAFDGMLAGEMEVELKEREPPAVQGDRTALGHVHLDRVTVVHHVRPRALPLDCPRFPRPPGPGPSDPPETAARLRRKPRRTGPARPIARHPSHRRSSSEPGRVPPPVRAVRRSPPVRPSAPARPVGTRSAHRPGRPSPSRRPVLWKTEDRCPGPIARMSHDLSFRCIAVAAPPLGSCRVTLNRMSHKFEKRCEARQSEIRDGSVLAYVIERIAVITPPRALVVLRFLLKRFPKDSLFFSRIPQLIVIQSIKTVQQKPVRYSG